MKNVYLFCLIAFSFGCKQKSDGNLYLSESNGILNEITVVCPNLLWDGPVGDSIRNAFAETILGIPESEPQYTMKQIPTPVFTDFARRGRLILKIDKKGESNTTILKNVYAKPQTVVQINSKTMRGINAELKKNLKAIKNSFNQSEIREKQRRIKKSLLNVTALENELGIAIKIPSVYRIAKADSGFYWIRKSLSDTKTMDIMLYEVSKDQISKTNNTVLDILKIRDFTLKNIPGPDADSFMVTEQTFAPYFQSLTLNENSAYETRGSWIIPGHYMGGPFINYAIEDEKNNRYIIAEGYIYAPSYSKRDLIFELESILKSVTIL